MLAMEAIVYNVPCRMIAVLSPVAGVIAIQPLVFGGAAMGFSTCTAVFISTIFFGPDSFIRQLPIGAIS